MDPSEEQFQPKKPWLSAHHVIGYVFLLVVAAAAVAGIYYWQTTSNLDTAYQLEPVHQDPTANWQTYTNAQYGFSIKFPSNWYGYTTTNKEVPNQLGTSIGFNLPYTFNGQATLYNDAIQIVIYTPAEWANATEIDGSKSPILAQNNQYIFSYTIGQDLGGNPDLDQAGFQVKQILSTFVLVDPTAVKTYTSDKLGVQFQYLAIQGDPVTESGNIITVGGSPGGQTVEEFSKNPSDSLTVAIQKMFLSGITASCPVVSANVQNQPANVETAEIDFNFQVTGLDDPRIEQSPCPVDYRETNAIRYFWMDSNHPDKFFFFDIGQYAIMATPGDTSGGGKTWQDTFQVIQ